jgi:predicted nucleic acid-binding protein
MKKDWPDYKMTEIDNNYFIDTNIIMYAAGREHEYKDYCVKILRNIDSFEHNYLINTEVIQEILYRYDYINLKIFGIDLALNTLELFDNILQISVRDLYLAIDLLEKYPFLISRDALIIANMVNNEVKKIISADKVFDKIEEILRIDPKKY